MLDARDGYYAADLAGALGQDNNPEWKTVAWDQRSEHLVAPDGSVGSRWGEKGKWNLEQRSGTSGEDAELCLSLLGRHDEIADVGFPYFGGQSTPYFNNVKLDNVLPHKLPVKRHWQMVKLRWSRRFTI